MTSAEVSASSGGLSRVLKRGVGYSTVGFVVGQFVIVIQTIALGRLLGPEEVGTFTAGSLLVGSLLIVTHGTLSQGLVQREDDIEDAANTVLIVTAAMGLILGLGVLLSSPLVGHLFNSDRVGQISAATSGLMVLYLCVHVPQALMQRKFQFKQRMVIDPAAKLAFAAVSIVFAVWGYGAWAMVIGFYTSIITELVLSWWMAKWRPFHGRFSWRIWRELAVFSLPLFLERIAECTRDTLQQVLVGRSLGTVELGQYRYAYRLSSMPAMANVEICGHVLFPAFSRIAFDSNRFREAFLRALGWTWFAALPLSALLVLVGEPAAVLLLGQDWRPAGVAAMTMAGMGAGAGLIAVSVQTVKGAGRSSLVNWFTLLGLGFHLPLIVVLLPYGLVGVGLALSASYLIVGIASVLIARSVAGASLRDVGACLTPFTLSAMVALAAVLPLEHLVVRSDEHATLPGLLLVVGDCVAFGLVYIGALRLLSPTRYRAIHGVVVVAANRLHGLNRPLR